MCRTHALSEFTHPQALMPCNLDMPYRHVGAQGANVSVIMPQPFAGRHAGYLSHYAQVGHLGPMWQASQE